MRRGIRAAIAALLIAWLSACDENGRGGIGTPAPAPPPTMQNPCSAAAAEAHFATGQAVDPERAARKGRIIDGDPRGRYLEALWTHRQRAVVRATPALTAPSAPTVDAIDIGEIAVVPDEGDLIAQPNAFDLRGAGLRFSRNASGGYDVRRIDGTFRSTLGTPLSLTDDDSAPVDVPFAFPFYGTSQRDAFVNSDGNITFEEEDRASTERNVARLLTGPPRVAPFLADLDPSAGGRVFAHAVESEYTVTWCSVRGFDSNRVTTVQATLLPDGTIEMKYGDAIGLLDAVVGVSPGRTGDFQAVNLSDGGPTPGGTGAVGERFAERGQLDTVAVSQKFYRTHPDDYDQLIIWTDASLIRDAFAYETTVANEIRGIGTGVFDASLDFGSAGRLRSLAVMDFIGKYPDDPVEKFLGENTTLSVLGQEVGHRWLAFLEFRDHSERRSEALLGRGQAHWSFFFDSDASVMEGNDIQDLGGGSFRTVDAVRRYSLLDQYAMGLLPESDVPPFFYVESAVNSSPSRTSTDSPQIGVTFNGTRRDVLIQDVIAIHGPRVPSSAESPRVHRQAFLFVTSGGRSPAGADVAKIDRIRGDWETFFRQATDGRMEARTNLR
ncbi:MAG TPA: hypothetical protein VLD67_18825 [Vicinamibacterales bacterium]|nr:hypothetical protein [Vicinamibacterales bacterium]